MKPDWLVRIDGDTDVLRALEVAFTTPSLRVFTEGGRHYLRSTYLERFLNADEAVNGADGLLRSAIALVNLYGHRVGDVFAFDAEWRDEAGILHGFVSVRGTARVVHDDQLHRLSEPRVASTLGGRLLALAQSDARVSKALQVVGNHDPSWADLYVLLEHIVVDLEDTEGLKGMDWLPISIRGWAAHSEVKRFKRSADFHRHSRRLTPPRGVLSLPQAQLFVKRITLSWLESKAT